MQIMDFLRGRWLVLAVVVPLVAGVMAYAIIATLANERYQARGWVGVTQSIVGEPTPQALDATLDTFEASLESVETVNTVADATGLTAAEVASSLESEPVAADLVQVMFTADDEQTATGALNTAVRTTLTRLADRSLRRATFEAGTAAETFETVSTRLQELQDQVGVTDVAGQYRNLSSDILSLRNQLATASVTDSAVAEALRTVLAEKEAERNALGTVLNEYERVAAQAGRAAETSGSTQSQVNGLNRLIAEINSGDVLTSVEVEEVSSSATVLRATLAAMAGAFAFVLAAAVITSRRPSGPVVVEERSAA